ncbi:MAG: hypothetical protein ABL953_10040 [Ilumatobacteraceae bacterium]
MLVTAQLAVDHVVARWRTVEPSPFLDDGLMVTHQYVLDQSFAVVLINDAVDTRLHSSRRRVDVDASADHGMECDSVLLEQLDKSALVGDIARQPIELPHDHV